MNKLKLIPFMVALALLLTACPQPPSGGTVKDVAATAGPGNITVTWKFDGKEADIQGFQIYRNPDSTGAAKYGPIGGKQAASARSYTDNTADDTTKTYKYGVAVIGKDGKAGTQVNQAGSGTKPNPATVTISLSASSTAIALGDSVTLTATVSGASSVAFFQDGTSIGTDNSAPFETTVTPTAAGSYEFTAQAGTVTSNAITVTVSDPGDLAPDATYKTLAGVPLHAGTPATGTAVTAEKLAVGGAAGGASTPAKGSVTLNADGSFTYTPNPGATGSDSFTYTVGADTGTVTINIQAANVVSAANPEAINSAAEGSIIVLASGTHTCPAGNCITLKKDQTLVGQGSSVKIGDITLSTGSGSKPVLSGAGTNAIVLVASDTAGSTATAAIPAGTITIQGINLDKVAFRGIVGMDRLSGTINISDVDIAMDTTSGTIGEALHIRETYSETFPHKLPATGGDYVLNIDDLVITGSRSAEGAVRANDFNTLSMKNSSIGMRTGRGVYAESEFASTAVVDGVTVTVAATATNTTAFRFLKNNVYENGSKKVDMNLTVTNTTATFNGASATEGTNTAYSFEVLYGQTVVGGTTVTADAGRIFIDETASTGNTSNVATPATKVAKLAAAPTKISGDISF